jgi:hypothetical protein
MTVLHMPRWRKRLVPLHSRKSPPRPGVTPAHAAEFADAMRGEHPYPATGGLLAAPAAVQDAPAGEAWNVPSPVMPVRNRAEEMGPAEATAFAAVIHGFADRPVFTGAQDGGMQLPMAAHDTVMDFPPDMDRPYVPEPEYYVPDLGADLAELPLFRAALSTTMRHGYGCRCCGRQPEGGTWAERYADEYAHLLSDTPAPDYRLDELFGPDMAEFERQVAA